MIGALWTGISGLSGQQRALDNESNNIANVNTIGYKASRIAFSDQIYQDNIGKGVSTFEVEKLYTQGNLKVTGVDYDMALSGDGFFQLSDGHEMFYSRAGNFRMGQNGTLQNAGGYSVQGWAMSPVQPDSDVVSTDSNATKITNDYSKLLGNVIIRNTQSIDTIVAKATDYTETSRSDVNSIHTGASYKTAATKISDVELLISEYNTQLNRYADTNPKPTATSSRSQIDLLDYDLDTVALDDGDEMYVYIDGTKYSQSFDTDESTTIKKLIDKLSNIAGMDAYLTDGNDPDTANGDPSEPSPRINTSTDQGKIILKSLIPGKQFRVTEFGWIDASNSNQATKGTVQNIQQAKLGTGMGAIKSVESALSEAVSGKQQDIYTVRNETGTLYGTSTTNTAKHYKYQIDIYDKELKKNITIPSTPLPIDTPNSMDDFAKAINKSDELKKYINAYVINGNLKVEPKNANYDVEFTTHFSEDAFPSVRGGTGGGSTPAVYDSFSCNTAPNPDGAKDYTIVATNDGTDAGEYTIAITDPSNIDAIVSAINADNAANSNAHLIAENIDGKLVVWPSKDDGSGNAVKDEAVDTSNFRTKLTVDKDGDGTSDTVPISRSALYSGKNGAGGEFISMTTSINQTSVKNDIQLRLDTLALTDSAFGDFRVDESGLITIKQDGADFAVGQVAVAKFTDNRGLDPAGNNLLRATNRSGQAIFNINNNKTALIKGGTLELSTADLSESLVNLMVFQRAFEANSKSISTADQILTTLIQLKR